VGDLDFLLDARRIAVRAAPAERWEGMDPLPFAFGPGCRLSLTL
jgi:hypothetical protein